MYPTVELYSHLSQAGTTFFDLNEAYNDFVEEETCPEEQLPYIGAELLQIADFDKNTLVEEFVLKSGNVHAGALILMAKKKYPNKIEEQNAYLHSICNTIIRAEKSSLLIEFLDLLTVEQLEGGLMYAYLYVALDFLKIEEIDRKHIEVFERILKKAGQEHMYPVLFAKLDQMEGDPELILEQVVIVCSGKQVLDILQESERLSEAFKNPEIHYSCLQQAAIKNNYLLMKELVNELHTEELANEILCCAAREHSRGVVHLIIQHMIKHKIKLGSKVLIESPKSAPLVLQKGIKMQSGALVELSKNKAAGKAAVEACITMASYGYDPISNSRLKTLLSPKGRCKITVTNQMIWRTKNLKKKRIYDLLRKYAKE